MGKGSVRKTVLCELRIGAQVTALLQRHIQLFDQAGGCHTEIKCVFRENGKGIVETEDEYPRLVLTEASKELLRDHVGELDL